MKSKAQGTFNGRGGQSVEILQERTVSKVRYKGFVTKKDSWGLCKQSIVLCKWFHWHLVKLIRSSDTYIVEYDRMTGKEMGPHEGITLFVKKNRSSQIGNHTHTHIHIQFNLHMLKSLLLLLPPEVIPSTCISSPMHNENFQAIFRHDQAFSFFLFDRYRLPPGKEKNLK